jgi:hypothetical protein
MLNHSVWGLLKKKKEKNRTKKERKKRKRSKIQRGPKRDPETGTPGSEILRIQIEL